MRVERRFGASRHGRAAALGVLALLVGMRAGESHAEHGAAKPDQLTPVLASVLAPPRAVRQTDGRWRLPYEIELTNVADVPMTIESVEVRDGRRADAVLLSLDGAAVARNLKVPGATDTARLDGAHAGVLLINLDFASRDEIPKSVEHWITVSTPEPKGSLPARTVERVAPAAVASADAVVLSPPLRGKGWIAAASCCDTYHRKAILPIDGKRHVAQRFAIDWIQVDAEDRLAIGDPKRNESYPQFGAEVLAVANARVVHVTDGLPEGIPGAMPSDTTVDNADGNSVVLDLGGGYYALYAHLQPGSIRVHEGGRVRRGQVLALLGNTGNSDAPHLHFHVMDGPSPLASNGLPYVFDSFALVGEAVSDDALETQLKNADEPVEIRGAASRRSRELPANLAVIDFGR
jgi:hypothetical protein